MIAQAREGLAEVTLFRLETRHNVVDPINTWHAIGNLVIASAAFSIDDDLPADFAADALEAAGGDRDRAHDFFDNLLTLRALRSIYALGHIPNDAPEIRITKKSRELKVDKFLECARGLKPDSQEFSGYEGNGRNIFLGSYIRRLS